MELTKKQLILIIGIGILIIATGVAWYYKEHRVLNKQESSTANTNTVVNVNTPTNGNLALNSSMIDNINTNTSSNTNTAIIEGIPDTTPPEITNIKVSDITKGGATITWSTNENSTSVVEYGTTEDYELGSLSESRMISEHVVSLTGLEKNTAYHFRVKSQDAEENETVSGDYGFTAHTKYSLKVTKTIGVPYANPIGIATDQENLWLIFGTHNSMEHKLIYYNINTGEVIKSFDFYNLIEVLGTGVYGITWDGTSIWVSVSGNTNKLVRVDPDTGEILTTWSSPTTLGPSDLAWDGNSIWVSSGTGQVYTVNPTNGGSSAFLKEIARDNGVVIQENEVWVGDLFDNNVNVYNKNTGTLIQSIKNAFSQNGNFCIYRGEIAVVNSAGVQFYSIEPSS
jgi:hypothetical protein